MKREWIEGIVKGEWIKDHTQRDQEKRTSVLIQTIRRHRLENAVDERESAYNTKQQ